MFIRRKGIYYYTVETYREGGKVKQRQKYLGKLKVTEDQVKAGLLKKIAAGIKEKPDHIEMYKTVHYGNPQSALENASFHKTPEDRNNFIMALQNSSYEREILFIFSSIHYWFYHFLEEDNAVEICDTEDDKYFTNKNHEYLLKLGKLLLDLDVYRLSVQGRLKIHQHLYEIQQIILNHPNEKWINKQRHTFIDGHILYFVVPNLLETRLAQLTKFMLDHGELKSNQKQLGGD